MSHNNFGHVLHTHRRKKTFDARSEGQTQGETAPHNSSLRCVQPAVRSRWRCLEARKKELSLLLGVVVCIVSRQQLSPPQPANIIVCVAPNILGSEGAKTQKVTDTAEILPTHCLERHILRENNGNCVYVEKESPKLKVVRIHDSLLHQKNPMLECYFYLPSIFRYDTSAPKSVARVYNEIGSIVFLLLRRFLRQKTPAESTK